MKAIALSLLLNTLILSPFNSFKEMDLIGKWRVETIRITRPGICLQTNFEELKESTFEFTSTNFLVISLKNNQDFSEQSKIQPFSVQGDEIVLKSKASKEEMIWKYTVDKSILILQVSNLLELTLKRQ